MPDIDDINLSCERFARMSREGIYLCFGGL